MRTWITSISGTKCRSPNAPLPSGSVSISWELSHVVQNLFAAGIPVWFIRPDASVRGFHLATKDAVKPSDLCTDYGSFGEHELYVGLSGTAHLPTCAPGTPRYFDISHAPLIASYTAANYSAPPPTTTTADNRPANPSASSISSTGQWSRVCGVAMIYSEQAPLRRHCEYRCCRQL